MKKIKLTKTTHNGLTCWKDETKLFMICKEENYYKLYRAKEQNDHFINELKAWGYEQINSNWKFKTLKNVKIEIEDIIKFGHWFDAFQKDLKYKVYGY